ncbi:MAG TPA: DUF4861 family protein [Phycisphaerae bacterium]|jgi:hypothetical protein|nr:DUF4861 family protein [Phycisphaerae bacterium]
MPRCNSLLLLAASILAGSSIVLTGVRAQTAPAATGPCMARYTGSGAKPPERWDDIFWENDRTAHRIYGPAVSRPAPNGEGLVTSGIDIWVKKTREPFMDRQLMTNAQHDDTTGMGRDCYDVQATCGAGGLGIWDDASKKLMRSANWSDKGGFVTGGDVASFWVTYAPWDAGGGRKVKEKRTFTLPAGTNFTRMVDVIDDASTPANTGDLLVGIGIAKRAIDNNRFLAEPNVPANNFVANKEKGVFVYWEPEQHYRTPLEAGHTGVAVLVDPKSIVKVITDDPAQNLIIVKVTPGKPWVYYTGACWSLGLDFKTQPEWEKYAMEYKTSFDPEFKYTAQSVKDAGK